MKVYLEYELPDNEKYPMLKGLSDFGMRETMLKHKYRTMWQLRSLEKEINESNGMIIVHQNGRIDAKNFTPELMDKIMEILKADLD